MPQSDQIFLRLTLFLRNLKMDKNTAENSFHAEHKQIMERYTELLRYKSISTDSEFAPDCAACAQMLSDRLKKSGFMTEVIPTSGQPAVYASRTSASNTKTVLFYGHYDVQPVDPLSLWNTDPFEPTEKDGRMYARGAQDNKGQLSYVVSALESLIKEDSLKCNVKILLEGEEECGSKGILEALPKIKDKLKADILLVCDTGTFDPRMGCVTMGLRGIAHCEVKLQGPSKDLHSGVHGGLVKNPAVELSKMIVSLFDDRGKIAIPGFYDDVAEIDPEDRKLANSFSITPEMYKHMVGVLPTGGEQGLSFMERRGFRPTIEVNGMFSGYTGEGAKTIIPSYAQVKLSTRTVADQDPQKIVDMIVSYLKSKTPSDLTLEVVHAAAAGPALLVSSKSPVVAKAREILDGITGVPTLLLWEGASIPLIPELIKASGAAPLLVGFGLEEDNIHAPNESFSLDQFRKGYLFSHIFFSTLLL